MEPAEFIWKIQTGSGDSTIDELTHEPTGYHLRIGWSEWNGGYNLADRTPRTDLGKVGATWESLRPAIRRWLQTVKQDVDAPDLWAAAREQRVWISEVPSVAGNSPFTDVEQELIAQHLKTIEAHIGRTAALSEKQHAELKSQIAYLTEATARLGRFDWRGLASSTFISIVLQLGLTPERASGFMALASQLLGPFIARTTALLGGS